MIANSEMMTENFCGECDEVVHALFNTEDFYDHKVGRIRCSKSKDSRRCCEGIVATITDN